jgi:hypothetical protein
MYLYLYLYVVHTNMNNLQTIGVIRGCKSKEDKQYHGQKKMDRTTNKWSTQLNTEHRKLNIEQHEPHYKTGVESGVSEE